MGKESSNRALYKTIQGIRNNRRDQTRCLCCCYVWVGYQMVSCCANSVENRFVSSGQHKKRVDEREDVGIWV